ncbi:MAG: RagB/SusD family nutrient uptake outer membrane protein [Bacteroidota bacterium]
MQFRYAQTCIHMAEAYLEDGNMGKALEWYNKTWTRAGNTKRETPIKMDDIRDEHARELGLEGHRWTYLKRIGESQSQITQYAGEESYNTEARDNWKSHHVRWPIPQEQLLVFGDDYPQNEGYPR